MSRSAILSGMRIALCVLLLMLVGCASPQGKTDYRIRTTDVSEEKAIRRQLWRMTRALEDVRITYGLMNANVTVVILDKGGLGSAMPTMSPLAEVRGARITIKKELLLSDHPELDNVLLGLAAHEMAHLLHYKGMSTVDLVDLGLRYDAALKNPNGPQREWVRTYERMTDMTAIALGYGEALIWQKWAAEANLAENDPPGVWDFYLTESEIRAYMEDEEKLNADFLAALDELKLPSLKRMPSRVDRDEDGDLILK